ncbi:MAG: hypothetical protein U1G07_04155 [Verrucomicrobiota bacterium]
MSTRLGGPGPAFLDLSSELIALHPGHDQIGDFQVEGLAFEFGERLGSILGRFDLIPAVSQQCLNQVAHGCFIVHNKNGLLLSSHTKIQQFVLSILASTRLYSAITRSETEGAPLFKYAPGEVVVQVSVSGKRQKTAVSGATTCRAAVGPPQRRRLYQQ